MKMTLMIPIAALALAGCKDSPQQPTPVAEPAAQAVAAPEEKAEPAAVQEGHEGCPHQHAQAAEDDHAGHEGCTEARQPARAAEDDHAGHEGCTEARQPAEPAVDGHAGCEGCPLNRGGEAHQHAQATGEGHAGHEGCAGAHDVEEGQPAVPGQNTEAVPVTDQATGAAILGAGAKLVGAPPVTIGDLIAKPERYVGKTVRVSGNISAMCYHRRGWFAVQAEGRGGAAVRVITAPAFKVPENSIGKKARAEGVVSLVEVPAGAARHYAEDHQVGSPAALQDDKPVQTVIIRATGAEFL